MNLRMTFASSSESFFDGFMRNLSPDLFKDVLRGPPGQSLGISSQRTGQGVRPTSPDGLENGMSLHQHKFDLGAGFESQLIPNPLGDGDLAFRGDGCRHEAAPYFLS